MNRLMESKLTGRMKHEELEKKKANKIIDELPQRIEKALADGYRCLDVMRIERDEVASPGLTALLKILSFGLVRISPFSEKAVAARIVFEHCQRERLSPRLIPYCGQGDYAIPQYFELVIDC